MVFEELYLLHPPLDFDFIFWDGFQLESSFSGRKLDPIKKLLKIRQEFEYKGYIVTHKSYGPPSMNVKIRQFLLDV